MTTIRSAEEVDLPAIAQLAAAHQVDPATHNPYLPVEADARGMQATRLANGALVPDATDIVVGVGGDGTLLAAVAAAYPRNLPVIGVNLGRVGYLTDVEPTEVEMMLDALATGEVVELPRMVVAAKTESAGPWYGINDVVLEKVLSQRIVHIGVEIGGEYFTTYRADGLIVSTPLGSTAYSLSAGGPVVDPALDALILTPLASHTLSARSLVVPVQGGLDLHVHDAGGAPSCPLVLDGQVSLAVGPDDRVRLRPAAVPFRHLTRGPGSFFEILRDKFGWAVTPRERVSDLRGGLLYASGVIVKVYCHRLTLRVSS